MKTYQTHNSNHQHLSVKNHKNFKRMPIEKQLSSAPELPFISTQKRKEEKKKKQEKAQT